MKHFAKSVLPALLVVLLSGCDSCSDKTRVGARDVVALEAPVVIEVPAVTDLARGLDGFVGQLTRKVGHEMVQRLRSGLAAQLGIDPLKATAWKHTGIAAERPIVMFVEPGVDTPLMALEVTDPKRFDKALRGLALRLDGANKSKTTQIGSHEVLTLGRPFGSELVPVVHRVVLGNVVVLAVGDGAEGLKTLIARRGGAAKSVAADPTYQRLSKRAGDGSVRIFLRGASAAKFVGPDIAGLTDGVALSLNAGPTGLRASGYLALALEGLEALGSIAPAAELARKVEPGAAAFVLSQLLRPEGMAVLDKAPALKTLIASAEAAMKKESGLSLRQDALPLLEGGVALSVYLSDLQELIAKFQRGHKSLKSLAGTVGVALSAKLHDPAKMVAALDQSRTSVSQRGVTIRRREVAVGQDTITLFEPDTKEPTLGWGVVGEHYFYGVGVGRAERAARHLLMADSSGVREVLEKGPAAKASQTPAVSVVVFRTVEIAKALEGFASQFQGEASGLGVDKLLGSAAALVTTLGDVALSVVPARDGIEFTLSEQLQ